MPGSFCTICRARIPKGSRCRRHELRSPSTRAWHEPGAAKLRLQILRRDGHLCTRCGAAATSVHHIVGAASGGSNDPANLTSLCAECHSDAHKESDAQPLP